MDTTDTLSPPSLMVRIAIGKAVGFLIGLIGFFLIPSMMTEPTALFQWGTLLWYTTVGAVIGVYGIFTYHPILKLPMRWWFRAPVIGAWFNFVLTLFIYDEAADIAANVGGGVLSSPFWFVAEGAIIGLLIGFLCTRFGGEGKATILDDKAV